MAIVGMGLMGIGWVIALVFGVMLLIQAFKVSVLWGLVYLFVPFGAIVFIVKFWDDAKRPFLMSLLSLPPILLGSLLMGMGSGA